MFIFFSPFPDISSHHRYIVSQVFLHGSNFDFISQSNFYHWHWYISMEFWVVFIFFSRFLAKIRIAVIQLLKIRLFWLVEKDPLKILRLQNIVWAPTKGDIFSAFWDLADFGIKLALWEFFLVPVLESTGTRPGPKKINSYFALFFQ